MALLLKGQLQQVLQVLQRVTGAAARSLKGCETCLKRGLQVTPACDSGSNAGVYTAAQNGALASSPGSRTFSERGHSTQQRCAAHPWHGAPGAAAALSALMSGVLYSCWQHQPFPSAHPTRIHRKRAGLLGACIAWRACMRHERWDSANQQSSRSGSRASSLLPSAHARTASTRAALATPTALSWRWRGATWTPASWCRWCAATALGADMYSGRAAGRHRISADGWHARAGATTLRSSARCHAQWCAGC